MNTDLDLWIANALTSAPDLPESGNAGPVRTYPRPEQWCPIDDRRLPESLQRSGKRCQGRLHSVGLQGMYFLWPNVIAMIAHEVGTEAPTLRELSNAYWAAIEGQGKVLCGRSLSWRR